MKTSKDFSNTDLSHSFLYLYHGFILFLGPSLDTAVHTHHLVQVVLGLEKEFKLFLDGRWMKARAALLDADVPHQFDSLGGQHAILLMDPEWDASAVVRQSLGGADFVFPDFHMFKEASEELLKCSRKKCFPGHARGRIDRIMECFPHFRNQETKRDERVKKVIDIIKESENKNMTLGDLAGEIYLSEGRLTHLFSLQTGIPLKRYILWMRLLDALKCILAGESFTTAAYQAGFSDSAHLSRTFRKMFGVTMLEIFRNYKDSRFVQVILDESHYIDFINSDKEPNNEKESYTGRQG